MSWLGEQFSSFTEKLTEITKDVLTDSGNSVAGGSSQQNDDLQPKQLIDLCKEKDAEIQLLMNEKESLEKSIEELDSQHQETIDELLHLKNEAVKENSRLRKELSSGRQTILEKSLFFRFVQNLQMTNHSSTVDPVSVTSIANSLKNINLVNIIGILWKNFNEETFNDLMKWLAEQIDSLESQTGNINVPLINRIKMYLRLLQEMSQNVEIFSPVVNELAALLYYFLSNNHDLQESTSNETINSPLRNNVNVNTDANLDTSDFSAQTTIPDFRNVLNLFSPNPEPFVCDIANGASGDGHMQTVSVNTVQDCGVVIQDLKDYIVLLEQEKHDLVEQVSQLNERVQAPSSTSTSDMYVQTDDGSITSKLQELEDYIAILEQEKSDLSKEISFLTSAEEKNISSVVTETDKTCSKICELQTHICILEQEKCDLQETLSELQRSNCISSTEIQTDDSYLPQLHELQTHIDILERENSDLQKMLSDMKIEQSTSRSISAADNSFDPKVLELQTQVAILEQEKSDLQATVSELQNERSSQIPQTQEASTCVTMLENKSSGGEKNMKEAQSLSEKYVSSVSIQTEKYECRCNIIYQLEAMIHMLEQERSDLEEEVSMYRKGPSSSVEIQTADTCSSISLLECECVELRKKVSEREKILNECQNEMMDEISLLREEVNCQESCIDEKENIINSLTFSLQECENKIKELSEMQSLPRSNISTQTVENACSYKSYQSQLTEMKKSIEERESLFSIMQNEMNLAIGDLKNELQSKINIINENELAIKALNCDLDSYDQYVKNLSDKSKCSKASVEMQTDDVKCSCESYKLQISELRHYAEAREKELDDIQNQITERYSLREELEEKVNLISKKDNILQLLKDQVEEQVKCIENLKSQIPPNKESTSVNVQTNENQISYNKYEAEISKLKEVIKERELELYSEKHIFDGINDLKKELDEKSVLINEKDKHIITLNSDVEKYRNDIDILSKELISLKSGCDKSCSCKKYESELADLKMYISEKDKIFGATQSNLISSVDSLKEAIKDKEGLIKERDSMISMLKEELEEAKKNMKIHFNELALNPKLDYAKDIDTMEESDIKMFVQNHSMCKNAINGESNDNDFKNEIKSLQEKLKALDLDKNQLLCVLNEKSQECSALKAEVHKLTNIVASEKQALFKLQQDNCMLRESADNSDPELTKEAIKRLSQLIRDKDLEIESLRQKNTTLTTLIQDGSSSPDHMQSIMEEKDNLEKQINVLKADRDKIMLRYNAIDKDCRQYATEIKALKTALSAEKEKFDVLEQKHFSVAQQYEEKQKSLINTQNEMIALKQRVTDLEEQQVGIKEKYSELLNKINAENTIQLSQDELAEKNTLIEELKNSNSEKDHLIQEKDCLIFDLSQQVKTLKSESEQQLTNLSGVKDKVEDLSSKLKENEAVVQKIQEEKEVLDIRFQDKSSEVNLLKEMNDRLNMNLKEKEFTINSMTEKISSLSHFISNDHSTTSDTMDINQILADSESMFTRAQSLYKERDETLLALSQSKQENQSLRNEIQRMKSNEIHLNKELDRLRMHLIEIEENYTHEALKAEEREKELRDEIVELKHRAEISNTAVVDTSQRASLQIASLQEQLSMIANQRDQALDQVSTLEDKVQQQATSVRKLQLVLEQIQRGNEKKRKDTEKKFIALLEKEKQLHKELEEKLRAKEMQLEESSQALEAASRLSEQLDAKEEIIANLKSELSKTENKIKSTTKEIDNIKSNTEGKVDRVVMKSLVLGYFSTPPSQKSEVIRLLARVLDFNQEEMEKAGIVVGRNVQKTEQKGLFSSIFGRLPSLSTEHTQPSSEKSFTTLFVQFLENESQPFVPMRFPAEKMSPELPFNQPSTSRKSPSQQKKLSLASPLFLDIDSAFPTFSPVPAVEYPQPSPSILREVLK